MIVIPTLFLLSFMSSTEAGYLTGGQHSPHHPTHNIPTVLSSRSFAVASTGTGPASGYSSSSYSQTVAGPAHVHSSFATQHPVSGQHGSGGAGVASGQQQGGEGGNQHFAYNYVQNHEQGNQGGYLGPNQGISRGQDNQGQLAPSYGGHHSDSLGGQGSGREGQRQSGYASFNGVASGHHYQYGYNH